MWYWGVKCWKIKCLDWCSCTHIKLVKWWQQTCWVLQNLHVVDTIAAGFSVAISHQSILYGTWYFGEEAWQVFCCTLTGASYKPMFIWWFMQLGCPVQVWQILIFFRYFQSHWCDELVVTLHDSFKWVIYWNICWVVDVYIVYPQLFN